MKQVHLTQIGDPSASVDCVDVAAPGDPGPSQVLVDVAAGPINPAEILLMKGEYASIPDLPAPLGIEGAGVVSSVGKDVSSVAPGDKVMLLPRANWAQQVLIEEAEAIRLPDGVDLQQASMLKVNPATAFLMFARLRGLAAR